MDVLTIVASIAKRKMTSITPVTASVRCDDGESEDSVRFISEGNGCLSSLSIYRNWANLRKAGNLPPLAPAYKGGGRFNHSHRELRFLTGCEQRAGKSVFTSDSSFCRG